MLIFLTPAQETHTFTFTLSIFSALDAAGPLFEIPLKIPEALRLTKGDADYVDSIHTNVGFLGFLESFAHADHYVDLGGPIQPGCLNINIFESSEYSIIIWQINYLHVKNLFRSYDSGNRKGRTIPFMYIFTIFEFLEDE